MDLFEKFPFQVKNKKKTLNPTTTVCLRSLGNQQKSAMTQLPGAGQLEQSGLIWREALKRQELKHPVSDRGCTEYKINKVFLTVT